MTTVRPVEIVRGVWGAALVATPRPILARLHHLPVDAVSVAVARVLGMRHLLQAAVTATSPGRELLTLGVLTDIAHALSTGLLLGDRARRRGALTEGAIAGGFALVELLDTRSAVADRTADGRRRSVLARWVVRHLPEGPVLVQRLTG
jgi:hypothetical protein